MKDAEKINGTIEKNPFHCIEGFRIGAVIHWNIDPENDTNVNVFYEIVQNNNCTPDYYRPPTYSCYRSGNNHGALVVSDDPVNRMVLLKFERDLNFISYAYDPQTRASDQDPFREYFLASYDWLCDAVKTKALYVFRYCTIFGERLPGE